MHRPEVTRLVVWLAAIAVTAAVVVNCDGQKETEKRISDKEARNVAVRKRIAELAERHKADSGWANAFTEGREFSPPLSLEMQEAVAACSGRPVIFVTEIQDVFRRNEKYYLVGKGLNPAEDRSWELDFLFEIEVPRDTAEAVVAAEKAHPDAFSFCYAVVAKLSEARTKYERDFQVEGEGYDAYVEAGGLRRVVLIRGKCLEAVFLEDYVAW